MSHGLLVTMLLPVSAAYSAGFMGPDLGGEVTVAKDRGITQVLEQMWGTATWPPKGKGLNPGDKNFTGTQIELQNDLLSRLLRSFKQPFKQPLRSL